MASTKTQNCAKSAFDESRASLSKSNPISLPRKTTSRRDMLLKKNSSRRLVTLPGISEKEDSAPSMETASTADSTTMFDPFSFVNKLINAEELQCGFDDDSSFNNSSTFDLEHEEFEEIHWDDQGSVVSGASKTSLISHRSRNSTNSEVSEKETRRTPLRSQSETSVYKDEQRKRGLIRSSFSLCRRSKGNEHRNIKTKSETRRQDSMGGSSHGQKSTKLHDLTSSHHSHRSSGRNSLRTANGASCLEGDKKANSCGKLKGTADRLSISSHKQPRSRSYRSEHRVSKKENVSDTSNPEETRRRTQGTTSNRRLNSSHATRSTRRSLVTRGISSKI